MINWQFYWRRWHLCWVRNRVDEYGYVDNVLCIGPLQFRWWQ